MVTTAYKGRMGGRDAGYAETPLAVIAGAAAPLAIIENLESAPARHLVSILHTKIRDLPEIIVAGPALFAGAVVRIRWQVAMGLLSIGGSQPHQRDNEYHSIER